MEASVAHTTTDPTSADATTRTGRRRVAVWVAQHELWFLVVIVPSLIVPHRFTLLGLAVILLFWICRKVGWGYLTVRTPLDIPILGLLVMIPASLYASADLVLSRVALYQIIAGVTLFYGLVNGLRSQTAIRWAVGGLISMGLALAVIAPVAVQWPASKLFALPQVYRRFSLLVPEPINRNVLAGGLVMIVPIVTSLLLHGRFSALTRKRALLLKLGLSLILAWMLAFLFLTQSRGAFVALAVGALVLVSVHWQWLLVLSAGYGLAAAIGMRYVGLASIANSISTTDAIQGWAGRLEVWSRAVYMLQDFPYTGIGLGTFQRVVHVLYPLFLIGPDVKGMHAHNLFLQVGVDLGLPGLVAFVGLLSTSLIASWQVFQKSRREGWLDRQALALGLFASLVVMVVHGLADAVTWGTKPAVIPWAVLGVTIALHHVCMQGSGKRIGNSR